MWQPVSNSAGDVILESVFGPQLTQLGFARITSRKWVRSKKPEIREAMIIEPTKGGSYHPVWGFSLDYVPHFSGSTVSWHRTPKTSRLDLRYDPIDYEADPGRSPWFISSMHGSDQMKTDALNVAKCAIPRAIAFFNSVQETPDLVNVFTTQMAKPAVRFSFYNYIQQPLAYAFTLARLRNHDEAFALLKQYIEQYKVSVDASAKLRKLIEIA